jgi:hypothetical protein
MYPPMDDASQDGLGLAEAVASESGDSVSADSLRRRWSAAVGLLAAVSPELHDSLLAVVEAAAARARKGPHGYLC